MTTEVPAGPRVGRALRVGGAVVVAAVLLAAGMALGARVAGDSEAGPTKVNPVDVGFARDMQAHHAQAVEMSRVVRDATDDPEVRTLALDIMLTQQQQMGQMYGWLTIWGYSQTSQDPPMSWMTSGGSAGHDMSNMGDSAGSDMADMPTMPGMATKKQLAALAAARGVRAERIYLQLMIPHHRGALGMANDAAKRASQPQVRSLARGIVAAQTAEITLLEQMLAARGGPVDLGS